RRLLLAGTGNTAVQVDPDAAAPPRALLLSAEPDTVYSSAEVMADGRVLLLGSRGTAIIVDPVHGSASQSLDLGEPSAGAFVDAAIDALGGTVLFQAGGDMRSFGGNATMQGKTNRLPISGDVTVVAAGGGRIVAAASEGEIVLLSDRLALTAADPARQTEDSLLAFLGDLPPHLVDRTDDIRQSLIGLSAQRQVIAEEKVRLSLDLDAAPVFLSGQTSEPFAETFDVPDATVDLIQKALPALVLLFLILVFARQLRLGQKSAAHHEARADALELFSAGRETSAAAMSAEELAGLARLTQALGPMPSRNSSA
ncbi:MAG: hypothetical protein AAFX00_11960, partial [Pseudomonadota bacterium]